MRWPNFSSISGSERPKTSNTFRWISGRWIRMLPPPTSNPFRTRSYAFAFAVFGSRSSVAGAENGWWFETHFPSSSLQSNSGGSEYQT